MIHAADIRNLRSAIAFLEQEGEEIQRIADPVEGTYELAAIYAEQGGGVPVRPPTKEGPMFLFEQVVPQKCPVAIGLFGSRGRCAQLLGCSQSEIAQNILDAVSSPKPPVYIDHPPCQQVIQTKVNLDMLPIPVITPRDAGPYITMGLCMATDPDTGAQNVSVHRLCQQSDDTLTLYMLPGRHLEQMYEKAKVRDCSLPISINIGLDPAIYIASCCPTTLAPFETNELGIAGALRGYPVEIAPCISIVADCISEAEYVLEGEILPNVAPENPKGIHSLPEFLGYDGEAKCLLPLVKIKSITHHRHPIFQTLIGPGYEQSHLGAFGMEAAVLDFVQKFLTSRVRHAYCSSAGGGVLLLFLQFAKNSPQDDRLVRQAGLTLFRTFNLLKTIVLVDEDVDVFSEEDVWWAMTTRFQVDRDLITVRNAQGFAMDPSQHPDYSPSISSPGLTTKTLLDCTIPYNLKRMFQRSQFT